MIVKHFDNYIHFHKIKENEYIYQPEDYDILPHRYYILRKIEDKVYSLFYCYDEITVPIVENTTLGTCITNTRYHNNKNIRK